MVPYHDIRGWILKVDGWVVGGGGGALEELGSSANSSGAPKKAREETATRGRIFISIRHKNVY